MGCNDATDAAPSLQQRIDALLQPDVKAAPVTRATSRSAVRTRARLPSSPR
jgi:hypothetical protein